MDDQDILNLEKFFDDVFEAIKLHEKPGKTGITLSSPHFRSDISSPFRDNKFLNGKHMALVLYKMTQSTFFLEGILQIKFTFFTKNLKR